jgi:RNA-directed DNA polymerase
MNEHLTFSTTSTPLFRQIAAVPTLYRAWRKVRANRGAAGIDAISLQAFEKNLEANLTELSRNLLNKSYAPLPARYVTVPKANGKERELAILTVRDRVAQRAVLDAIEPLFEAQFLDCSFAFRPGRSVEMAVQHILVTRAHGFRWTMDADIQDFFPSIDHSLLLHDVAATVDDADVLRLLKQWLDADALHDEPARPGWLARSRSALAGAKLSIRDTIDHLLNELLVERLGVAETPLALGDVGNDFSMTDPEITPLLESRITNHESQITAPPIRRAVVRRLIEDGLLLAVAERGLLRRALTAKLLGLGGGALALAALAPSLWRWRRERGIHRVGTLQGAPVSPLLSNIYLHPFDAALTQQGLRLVRYCDDFVIPCQTERQARAAWQAAEAALAERRLRLHPDKTRLVSPQEPFDFLGYHFTADGRVVPPPTVPEVVARQIVELAKKLGKR